MRGAGGAAQFLAKEGNFGLIKLPSGEVRFYSECMATIGQVGNLDHENISLGRQAGPAGSAYGRAFAVSP